MPITGASALGMNLACWEYFWFSMEYVVWLVAVEKHIMFMFREPNAATKINCKRMRSGNLS